MPDLIFGIYGLDFTRPFTVAGIDIVPMFDAAETHQRATDRAACQLTGYGQFHAPAADAWDDVSLLHVLTGGMTFAQQRHVACSELVSISSGDTVASFIAEDIFQRPLVAGMDRTSYGSLIASDVWYPQSLAAFLSAFVDRFRIEQPGDVLRSAIFRQLEISRLATPFVELHHFLAFSGLEMLARSMGPHPSNPNAAVPITGLLRSLGFQITQPEVENWTVARNAAFHRGLLASPHPVTGATVRLADQLLEISNILADACLKLLPFDDGHINWSRWRDRQPFK